MMTKINFNVINTKFIVTKIKIRMSKDYLGVSREYVIHGTKIHIESG